MEEGDKLSHHPATSCVLASHIRLGLETLASAHLPAAPSLLTAISTHNIFQERLKAAEAKRIEKERTEKYNKLKTDAKDARAKYREKVKQFFYITI